MNAARFSLVRKEDEKSKYCIIFKLQVQLDLYYAGPVLHVCWTCIMLDLYYAVFIYLRFSHCTLHCCHVIT